MSRFTAKIGFDAASLSSATSAVHRALYTGDLDADFVQVEEVTRFTELDIPEYDQQLTKPRRVFDGPPDGVVE